MSEESQTPNTSVKGPRLPSARFTGKHGEAYYYNGVLWDGPTNLIGQKPFELVCRGGAPRYQKAGPR